MKQRMTTQKNKQGFTLIEVLVAVVVLSIALTGPLTVAFRSIEYNKVARDQIVATYLAQDAMEYIIAKKGYNIEEGNGYLVGIDESCHSGSPCQVETTGSITENLTACVDDCLLYLTDNQYTHVSTTGNETKFKRKITVTEPGNDSSSPSGDEANIKVTVEWDSGSITGNSFSLETNIFNNNI